MPHATPRRKEQDDATSSHVTIVLHAADTVGGAAYDWLEIAHIWLSWRTTITSDETPPAEQPEAEPIPEPVTEPVAEPVAEPAAEPVPDAVPAEPISDATATEPTEPALTDGTEPPADAAAAPPADVPPLAPPKPKRRWGRIIVIILLSLALAGAITVLILGYLKLQDANALIKQQEQKIQEQKDLIDKKDSFGAGMNDLMKTAAMFNGAPMTTIVPVVQIQRLAERGWIDRWDVVAVGHDIDAVSKEDKALQDLLAAASAQASSNATGTAYETAIDQLGHGFVASTIEDADAFCGQGDVLACVSGSDPYTVHFDAADNAAEYTTDFIRTGVAYHEFAHVLQFTNPTQTEPAVAAFGGDVETMADCFALTYVPGWSLHQTVFVNSYSYYEIDIGYGYTCNADQMQVIRDWYNSLNYQEQPVSQ